MGWHPSTSFNSEHEVLYMYKKILEVVRFGMKSRWVEHFSTETPAAIVAREDEFKGCYLLATRFTFMVDRIFLSFFLILKRF